jgi:hypothetical protein
MHGGQRRELLRTDAAFIAFDGRAAGSYGATPFYHGLCDADSAELGISNQFELMPRTSRGGGVPNVEGRIISLERDVTFFAWGYKLWPSRGRNHAGGGLVKDQRLQERHESALAAREADEPWAQDSERHCYFCMQSFQGPYSSSRWRPVQHDGHDVWFCSKCFSSLKQGDFGMDDRES